MRRRAAEKPHRDLTGVVVKPVRLCFSGLYPHPVAGSERVPGQMVAVKPGMTGLEGWLEVGCDGQGRQGHPSSLLLGAAMQASGK